MRGTTKCILSVDISFILNRKLMGNVVDIDYRCNKQEKNVLSDKALNSISDAYIQVK